MNKAFQWLAYGAFGLTDAEVCGISLYSLIADNVFLTADYVAEILELSPHLKKEVELLLNVAEKLNVYVCDLNDLRVVAEFSLDRKKIIRDWYLDPSVIKSLLRLIIIAEENGKLITHRLTLDDALVYSGDNFYNFMDKNPSKDLMNYFVRISSSMDIFNFALKNEDLHAFLSYYIILAGKMYLRYGCLNLFMVSLGFNIAAEYAYDIVWAACRILRSNPRRFNYMCSKGSYLDLRKPDDILKCDIKSLPKFMTDYNETGTNAFLKYHKFRFNTDYQYNGNRLITSKEPLNISGESTKEKGIQFENYCASLLKQAGFTNITTTKASGDHGVDILADNMDTSYVFQCKYYSGPVGNSAVQEAFSGRAYYDRDIAVVITNSVFTQQAIDEAARLKVKLWDGNKLREMQN